LENLIDSNVEERSLPSFIVIGIPSWIGSLDTLAEGCFQGADSERYNEYETMSDKFARFVENEVFTFVTTHPEIKDKFPNLKITNDPEGRAVYGCSHGGLEAFKAAFFRPDLFGIAIAYSASLVDIEDDPRPNDVYPLRNAEFWVPPPDGQELIKSTPKKPLRIFHNANDRDLGTPYNQIPAWQDYKYMNWAIANNETAAALMEMGYETRYAYGLEAGHCEPQLIAQDMPNTLVWAWDNWKQKQQQQSATAKSDDTDTQMSAGINNRLSFGLGYTFTVFLASLFFLS